MRDRRAPARGLLRQATALLMLVVPGVCAAATAPPEAAAHRSAGPAPTLAHGIQAMKRGSDYLAFAIIEPYARDGDRIAQANLATLYLSGRGTARDARAALLLFESAAAQGLPLAYGQLGAMHQRGEGAAVDPALALAWYRRGADAGDPGSLYGLALMYQNGAGVAADLAQAAKWYRMAASRGHARAKLMLGVMHYRGLGVRKDLIEAYMWFALAQAALPPGRDRDRSLQAASLIEASLRRDELEAARASARAWGEVR